MGHPVFAWAYEKLARRSDDRGTAERRRELLAPARGQVLEVGAGTGLNLPWYPPAVTEVLATEPDPHMYRRLASAVGKASVPVRLARAPAEDLPAEAGSIDTVVCSLVLCSVPSLEGALAEVGRVLKPDGRLLFFEHVLSTNDRLARWQDALETPWGWVGGGCHPNRDTVGGIERAGFRIESIRRWDEPGALLARPHVIGEAGLSR